MPYAFAHPAAVVPLAKLLGRRSVPSALAIGSMAPDAWYLVPLVGRDQAHSILGAFWFCLPVALLAYAAFHLIFKEPVLALMPRRLGGRLAAWTPAGLPAAPWLSVLVSVMAGVATHVAWDAFTHAGHFWFVEQALFPGVPLYRVLQHASTLIGTAFLAVWLWRKLRTTQSVRNLPEIGRRLRLAALAGLLIVPAAVFVSVLAAFDPGALRTALRAGGITALSTLGLVLLFFCLVLNPRLRARPRRSARASSTARPR